jgi:hypothetical protein
VVVLVGASVLLLAVLLVGAAAHICMATNPRVFFWPHLQHPDERHYAARLATLPWWLLIHLAALNALAVVIFSEDLRGDPTTGPSLWLLAMVPPVLMVHLLGYCHSRLAALLTLLLVAGTVVAVALHHGSWLPVAVASPLLLWSVNGVRATFADRAP